MRTIIWKITESQAVGTVQAEGVRDAVLGDGGDSRGHETVPGEGGDYWSLCVPKGGARSGLPQEPLWGRQGPEI